MIFRLLQNIFHLFNGYFLNVLKRKTDEIFFILQSDSLNHFFQTKKVEILPVEHTHNGYTEWFVLFFFGVLFLLILIWFFFPERFLRLIYSEDSKVVKRIKNSQFNNPGVLFIVLIIITFISSTTVVSYFIIKQCFGDNIFEGYTIPQIFTGIALAIFIYYLIRFLIIFFSAIIFTTVEKSKKLLSEFLKLDVIQGIIFVPLIFFIYFSSPLISVCVGVMILSIIYLLKWYKIFFIGMSFANVSVLHNILYICTLEIIPVYALMKLMNLYQLWG